MPNYTRMLCYYFDSITEICVRILSKSNGNRENKINLRAEIKKLVWNYAEDLERGKEAAFDEYVEKLLQLFQPYLSLDPAFYN